MRSFLLGVVCGAIVMAVAGGIAVELLREPPAVEHLPAVPLAVSAAASRSETRSDAAETAKKLESASDAALAETLDAAEFDRDWGRVNGVGRALRSRSQLKVDPLTGLAETGAARTKAQPLVALEAEVARRAFVLELRSHDNAATRLIDKAGEDETATRLADLFLAEAKPPEYEPLRADAAVVLALGASDRARDVLARALKEGGERGNLAARALGLSDDEKAIALLTDLLGHDLDAEVRKRAAAGLARSSAVARGAPEAVGPLVRAAREDTDESVRARVLGVVGAVDLARVEPARTLLVNVIREPSEPATARIAAVQAIKAHRAKAHATPPDLVDALLKTLAAEHDGPLRAQIADALVDVAPANAAPALESALRGAQDPAVREALTKALAAAKDRGEPPP